MIGSVSLAHVHGEGKRPDLVIVLVPRRRQVNFACDDILAVPKNTISSGVQHEQERAAQEESRNGERTDQRKLAETPCSPPHPLGFGQGWLGAAAAIKFKSRV
jgi:hypothetical protein